jgi:hypothetical protein
MLIFTHSCNTLIADGIQSNYISVIALYKIVSIFYLFCISP